MMHVSCLGITQYLSGNIMKELYQEMGGTRSTSVRVCGNIQNIVSAASKAIAMETPFTTLTIQMILPTYPKANIKPKMKLKAATGRRFF